LDNFPASTADQHI
jgi:hypothetical protein